METEPWRQEPIAEKPPFAWGKLWESPRTGKSSWLPGMGDKRIWDRGKLSHLHWVSWARPPRWPVSNTECMDVELTGCGGHEGEEGATHPASPHTLQPSESFCRTCSICGAEFDHHGHRRPF